MLTKIGTVLLLVSCVSIARASAAIPDAPSEPREKRGCCSHHGGVCGCSDGRAKCCDGALSPTCGC